MNSRSVRMALAAAALSPALCLAQQQPTTTTVVTPQFDFSGIIFGSFGARTDSLSRATLGGASPNQFGLDRAYLNFRMPAGDNGQIRITPDVFVNQNNATNAYYQGWALRIKYAYVQYTGFRNQLGNGSNVLGRIGALQTVIIDHVEGFWPRYLGVVATERYNFFSSADLGAAGLATLPNRWGEVYATVTNGPGYTAFERDRFKDVALRVSLTPLASQPVNAILKTFTISPWAYKGWLGSAFAAGGVGQIGPGDNGAITSGMRRDRFGIFTGLRERRLTAGLEFAQRTDEGETGLNTTASPRLVRDSTGRLFSGFVLGRPVEWFNASYHSNFSFVARYDHFTPNVDPISPNYVGTTPSYTYWVLGASYDVNQRFTLTLDWQVQNPNDFPPAVGTTVRPVPRQSSAFLHWVATF